MGQPLLAAAAAAPVTSLTAAALVCVHAAIAHRGAGYEDVGCSYALIAERRLWHRAVLAAVSHVSTLHLVMNCAALWAVRDLERALGSSAYARASLLLVLGVAGVSHATYCVLIRKLGREEYSRHVVVGYSGVVFGLMALAAARAPFGATISLGGLHAPAVLSPFVSLVITHMLIPNASFVGHASGIIVGYTLATGLLKLVHGWLALALALCASAACVHSAGLLSHVRTPQWLLRRLSPSGTQVVDGLGPARVVDGRIVREPLEKL